MAGSSTSRRASAASKSRSRASNASRGSAANNKSQPNDAPTGYTVPYGSLLVAILCSLIHFKLIDLPMFSVNNACCGLYQVFYYKEYLRILTCHFVHKTPWELAFQLISLLWKGYQIERRCGPKYILMMILLFAPVCSLMLFIVHKILADVYDPVFVTTCYCGLAAINLAMKIVNQYQDTDNGPSCIYQNYCVEMKYMCWFEVLLAHFVSDQSTLPANVAGLLVGLLFISGVLSKPLSLMMSCASGEVSFSFSPAGWLSRSPSHGFGAPVKTKPSARSSEPAVSGEDHELEGEDGAASE